ncbi:hypothetical protein [uncultured Mediterranean phage uvMED]|nr:hypothetical protein [uncultured Mediterranean phage uvMED]
MRTIKYLDLLKKYTSIRGVDELLDQEKADFSNSLNHRIKQIWTKSKWPDLIVVVEKTIQVISTPTLKAENAVRIDNATDLLDVFGVFNKNPYEEAKAIRIEHTLIDGYLVLPRSSTATTVFVVGSKVPHDDYGEGYFSSSGSYREDIPAFMESMLLSYAMHDHYLADGQGDKALVEMQKAEQHMADALERFERIESQSRITVNTYPPSIFHSYIAQRNV